MVGFGLVGFGVRVGSCHLPRERLSGRTPRWLVGWGAHPYFGSENKVALHSTTHGAAVEKVEVYKEETNAPQGCEAVRAGTRTHTHTHTHALHTHAHTPGGTGLVTGCWDVRAGSMQGLAAGRERDRGSERTQAAATGAMTTWRSE